MFRSVEWLIAWRYLRSKRADGGVSVISVISLIGIALGVFAMIATFAVREGFRSEFVSTILGNEGHASVYHVWYYGEEKPKGIADYEALSQSILSVEGVNKAVPLVEGQVMGSHLDARNFMQLRGIKPDDFRANKNITENELSRGDLDRFQGDGIALGLGAARNLGVEIGDKVTVTTASAVSTAFGSMARQYAYDVVYIFSSGNDFSDQARAYITMEDAQSFFNLEGYSSVIDLYVNEPDQIENYTTQIQNKIGDNYMLQSWKDKNATALRGLETEDRMMYILTGILVLVASFTIVAGIIMLVKNKTGDIAILRTMGYTKGAVTRIFFLAGVTLGAAGTALGVLLGILFHIFFQQIFRAINWIIGGGALDTWALQVIPNLQTELTPSIVIGASLFSLILSVIITYFPARSAAKLDPAEALRHG